MFNTSEPNTATTTSNDNARDNTNDNTHSWTFNHTTNTPEYPGDDDHARNDPAAHWEYNWGACCSSWRYIIN